MSPPYSRRDLLKSAAAALLPTLAACGDAIDSASTPARFDHGVASGDPLPTAVILWTRATPVDAAADAAVVIDWQLARDAEFREIVASGRETVTSASDYIVKRDVGGLAPGSRYFYRFSSGDSVSPIGRTRTAPTGAIDALRFGVVSCADYSQGLFNVYRRVAERDDLQAVIHLGDYIYENGAQDRVRPQLPARETLTLADYRERYATARRDADLQALHAAHPMIWVWDDHELANNAWRDGAEAHDPATEGDFRARRAAAFQAAHEWLPIRTPDPRDLSIIHRSFAFGDLAQLSMLDTRHVGRDQPLPPNSILGDNVGVFTQRDGFSDPGRQLLGAAQEHWLAATLAASSARWQLLGNQVYFSPLKLLGAPRALGTSLFVSTDKWDGYEPARDRVLALLAGVRNPVILTGDAHEAYAFDVTPDPNSANYNTLTGEGSQAVEFVVTSTTSRGDAPVGDSLSGVIARLATGLEDTVEQLLRISNPHLKHFNNRLNGYCLLDVTPARCTAEFWTVPFVATATDAQALDAVWVCDEGTRRLRRG
ncbi:alkaline phosphatase D family protein [Nevskia sp.]|uniref:alkaline phosphatase D family protein n=1 Tax=Nevskia sp. TaxID=1929292 RepID=UPI0025CD5600|nr:alkaline phosphatase D family protein [Nevskia sp.]